MVTSQGCLQFGLNEMFMILQQGLLHATYFQKLTSCGHIRRQGYDFSFKIAMIYQKSAKIFLQHFNTSFSPKFS